MLFSSFSKTGLLSDPDTKKKFWSLQCNMPSLHTLLNMDQPANMVWSYHQNTAHMMNTWFCIIWARMNHFETCLMVLSQKVDSKLLRMASLWKNINEKNNKMATEICEIVRILNFFEISFDTLASKPSFLQRTLKLNWIEVNECY